MRAYASIAMHGADGLRPNSLHAVLNANYLMAQLQDDYELTYPGPCQHEFVLSAARQKKESGVRAADISKRLLDYGIHAPTTYFPLIVPEALMIEPTETESRENLDGFVGVMKDLARMAAEEADELHELPRSTPVRRLDEVRAARHPILSRMMMKGKEEA